MTARLTKAELQRELQALAVPYKADDTNAELERKLDAVRTADTPKAEGTAAPEPGSPTDDAVDSPTPETVDEPHGDLEPDAEPDADAVDPEDPGVIDEPEPVGDDALAAPEPGEPIARDPHDAGVPMLAGTPGERVGPEDALGVGAKRGDYSDRVDARSHESRLIPGGGQPIRDPDTGQIVDYTPRSTLVPQAPRTDDVGDDPMIKGGVDTDPAAIAAKLGIDTATIVDRAAA